MYGLSYSLNKDTIPTTGCKKVNETPWYWLKMETRPATGWKWKKRPAIGWQWNYGLSLVVVESACVSWWVRGQRKSWAALGTDCTAPHRYGQLPKTKYVYLIRFITQRQCSRSLTFWYGSGFLFASDLQDANKKYFFFKFFLLFTFWRCT